MTRLSFDTAGLELGGALILGSISLQAEAGELIALTGPNGAGKSSLLRLAAGLIEPGAGQVTLDGVSLAGLPPRERARQIAYLPAESREAWPLDVQSLVALGRIPFRKPLRRLSAEDEAAIASAMERAGVSEFATRRIDTLSSGERARVHLARMLATQAPVLLLDEPTAALDLKHQLAVMEIAEAEAQAGRLVIMAMHALDLAARYASRVVLMAKGDIHADAGPDEALSEANIRAVFGVEAPGGIAASALMPLS
ncbi:ABC transporter ATP-binding protein [Maricaulis sp.]|uniref:ABC transporter ATP-binding protein n=1 Tax=Maricaulis sp. TaxID=1486257 RepID=UPI002639AA25|nr:ABC transporter ATP-binding protein [Maricaulis sp.]